MKEVKITETQLYELMSDAAMNVNDRIGCNDDDGKCNLFYAGLVAFDLAEMLFGKTEDEENE